MKPAVGSAAERNSHKAIDEKSQERKRQTNLCSVKALPGCFNFHRFHLRKLQYEFSILCNQLIRDPGFSIQIKISFHDHAPHFNLKTSSFQISILYYAFRTAGPFSSLKIKNSPAHHALQHSGIQDLLSPEFCDIFGIQGLLYHRSCRPSLHCTDIRPGLQRFSAADSRQIQTTDFQHGLPFPECEFFQLSSQDIRCAFSLLFGTDPHARIPNRAFRTVACGINVRT